MTANNNCNLEGANKGHEGASVITEGVNYQCRKEVQNGESIAQALGKDLTGATKALKYLQVETIRMKLAMGSAKWENCQIET